ncbi:MAG: ankyrin repeat domain-containing protein [Polyangiaceae bacterium]|nr:ankyrin repeat domain-containing protein [Polyangiaceae bacterium]
MSAELHRAIDNHDLDTLARLLAAGHDPDELGEGWAPLHNAMGDLEAVALLLRHGANPNVWDRDRYVTPLLTALFGGYRDAALMLLAAGADPNVKNCVGDFPLLMCAERGDLKMAATLLRAGATKTMEESGGCGAGMKALGYAAFRLDIEMIRLLLAWGASITMQDVDRRLPLDLLPERTAENAEKYDLALELLSPKP